MTLSAATPEQTRSADRFARVVPLVFVTYSLAFLDRNNYGYASDDMEKTLGLSPLTGKLLAATFFIGYFLFQIPSTGYAARRSVRWVVFGALILWGLFSALTGVIVSIPWLFVDRFLLGAVEGVVLPAMLVFITRWFTKRERSRANSLLMLANPLTMMYASAMSGLLIELFNRHHVGHRAGWQMMFIVEGLPSILWAFAWIIMSSERPANAGWLTPQDARAIEQTLDGEQTNIPSVSDYWSAFLDWRVIQLSVMFIFFSAAGYAFMFWMPRIVKAGTGQGIGNTGLLMAIPYLVASFAIVGVSWFSDKTMKRKPCVWGSHLVGATGYIIAAAAVPDHFTIAFLALIVVGCCTYTPTSPQWAWMAEMLPRNVIGESMALVNSAGALGGFAGSLLGGLLSGYFKSPAPMFLFCAGCLVIAGILGMTVSSKKVEVEARGFDVIVPPEIAN